MAHTTHARSVFVDKYRSEGLCGMIDGDASYYTQEPPGYHRMLRPVFSNFVWEVNCEDCLQHKYYELWILKHTSL